MNSAERIGEPKNKWTARSDAKPFHFLTLRPTKYFVHRNSDGKSAGSLSKGGLVRAVTRNPVYYGWPHRCTR
jgi:hypothetical protein